MYNAVSIGRISTTHQKENTSITTQFTANKEYIESQKWKMVKELQDNESGTVVNREGIVQALELIRLGQAEVIVFHTVDRMARDDNAFTQIVESIFSSSAFIAISTKRRLYKTIDEFIEDNQFDKFLSTYEHTKIRIRTRRGIKAVLEQGGFIGHEPYGYKLATKHSNGMKIKELVSHPSESKTLVDILNRFKSGVTLYQLSQEFNIDNFGTSAYQINKMVKNHAVYAGLEPIQLKYQEYSRDYYAPPLISVEDGREIGQLLKAKSYTKNHVVDPFRGLITCSCGKPYTRRRTHGSKGNNWVYMCQSRMNYNAAKYRKDTEAMKRYESYCKGAVANTRVRDALITYLETGKPEIEEFDGKEYLLPPVPNQYDLTWNSLDSLSDDLVRAKDKLWSEKAGIELEKNTIRRNTLKLDPSANPELYTEGETMVKELNTEIDNLAQKIQSIEKTLRDIGGFFDVLDTDEMRSKQTSLLTALEHNDYDTVSKMCTELRLHILVDSSDRSVTVGIAPLNIPADVINWSLYGLDKT